MHNATWASLPLTMLSAAMKMHTSMMNPPCLSWALLGRSESSKFSCVQKTPANDSVLSLLIHPELCLTFPTHLQRQTKEDN